MTDKSSLEKIIITPGLLLRASNVQKCRLLLAIIRGVAVLKGFPKKA